MMWIVVLAITICLTAIGVVAFLRSKAQQRIVSMSAERVTDILQQALLHRSVFAIEFASSEMGNRVLQGPCVKIDEGKLLIDVNLDYFVPNWSGQPVEVRFASVSKVHSTAYRFQSTLKNGLNYRGRVVLDLDFPLVLSENQRRAFVRFSPPATSVLRVQGWLAGPRGFRIASPGSMPTPELDRNAGLRFENISAGGIRLSGLPSLMALCELKKRLLLHLVLDNGEEKEPLRLWLQGEIVQTATADGMNFIGVHFLRWAQEVETPTPLEWFAASNDNGVPPLAAWVLLNHLAQSARVAKPGS